METNNLNTIREDEDFKSNSKSTTKFKEINDFQSKNNKYLIVSNENYGKAFLKITLYKELYVNSEKNKNQLKGRFFLSESNNNQSSKSIAELYQFKFEDQYCLVLYIKETPSLESQKFIYDYLFNSEFKIENIILFNSRQYNNIKDIIDVNNLNKKQLFVFKNQYFNNCFTIQNNIHDNTFPDKIQISGIFAYFIIKSVINKISLVLYEGTFYENEITVDSISAFFDVTSYYPFFNNKVNKEYIKDLDLNKILYEFNTINKTLYS